MRAKLEEELERLQERGWRLSNPVLIPHKLVNKQKNTTNNPLLVFVFTEVAAESVVMVIDQLILFCKDAKMSLFSRPRCVSLRIFWAVTSLRKENNLKVSLGCSHQLLADF